MDNLWDERAFVTTHMGSSTQANIRFTPFYLDRKDFREKVIVRVVPYISIYSTELKNG